MFRFLGQVVRRAWLLLLVAWGLLVLGTWLAAPPRDEVAQDREFAFLPRDSPSVRAEEVYAEAFPADRLTSSIVLVLHDTEHHPRDAERDRKFIEDVLEPALRKIAEQFGGLASTPAPSDEPLFGDEDKPK